MRVWVTRDETTGGPLSTALAQHGLVPVLEPVVVREPIVDASDALAALAPDDWLVVTSAYALSCIDPRLARVPRVAVVGPATAEQARAAALRVELVGEAGADRLFDRMQREVASGRVCWTRSAQAAPREPWSGVDLVDIAVYATRARVWDRAVLDRIDIAAFTSPSAVAAVGPIELPCASLGPTTSAALRESGIEPHVQAANTTFDALARAVHATQA